MKRLSSKNAEHRTHACGNPHCLNAVSARARFIECIHHLLNYKLGIRCLNTTRAHVIVIEP